MNGRAVQRAVLGAAVATAVLATCVVVSAQSNRWYDPYDKGRKAFEAGKYGEAVPLLERAVAAEPKAAANKIIEGVFRTDYFPYYYLAIAYAELGQWDKASQNLDKARPTLTRQQTAKFTETESKIKLALNTPAVPVRNPAFDNGLRQAETALGARNYEAAIRQFDQLRTLDASEYAKAGLAAKRDEAVKGYAGQLAEEGRTLIQNNRFTDAKARLQLAEQTLPGQKAVADALAEIRKREDDYRANKAAAQTEFDRRNYATARDRLQQAQQAHPEQFAAENLGARLNEAATLAARGPTPTPPVNAPTTPTNTATNTTSTAAPDPKVLEGQKYVRSAADLIRQGKYAEADAAYTSAVKADPKNQDAAAGIARAAKFKTLRDRGVEASKSKGGAATAQQALVDARNVDPDRFMREGLASILDRVTTSSGDDPVKVTLRQGLLALLNGRAQESIAILEPAVSRDGSRTASLHAYLGVAYATQALSAPKPEDQTRLKDKAVEQFRLAASAEPDYQLSNRIVSPAIIKLYESARR
jgi:tetratricopeptide (TPR) repeat protein